MRLLSLLSAVPFITTALAATKPSFGHNVVPYLPQSFSFAWDPPNQAPPIPITAQCDTINIQWGRGTTTGPSPVAPYKLVVHTSTDTVPYVIDAGTGLSFNWTVPFKPQTLYLICMFDTNGATGGCQNFYSMYPSPSGSNPGCANLTLPSALQVEATVLDGPLSQYGWVPQCSDISLVPKNGRPPYNMVVAPALHPPYRIVSNDMSPINWTVSLTWAAPFFISLTDADGLSWTNGPLHSGGPGTDGCLSSDPVHSGVATGVVVGSSVGALVFGTIVGIILASFFVRKRYSKIRRNSSTDSIEHATYIDQMRIKRTEGVPNTPGAPGPDMGSGQYLVEPFLPEGGNPTSPTHDPQTPGPTSSYSNAQSEGSSSGTRPAPHVYVVHHDAGGAPVTVFTGGAGVTELPPSYIGRSEDQPATQPNPAGPATPSPPNPTDRRPRPGPTPRKSQPGTQPGTQ